jgi:hypothetical protein
MKTITKVYGNHSFACEGAKEKKIRLIRADHQRLVIN